MSAMADVPEQMSVAEPPRRAFLGCALAAVGGLASAAMAVPLVRFAAFPLRAQAEGASWSDVGKADEFRALSEPVERTIEVDRVDGWRRYAMENGVYVVPADAGNMKVLSSTCPHLGCTLRWIGEKKKFICPCHGGTFTSTGVHVAGPPLRAMDELESKVENGVLKVRFQHFRQLIAQKEPVG
ncbi:MAG: ubiquinol-cytochrome c reductase iron-sulfur subunit [Terracidiphilus sp.]